MGGRARPPGGPSGEEGRHQRDEELRSTVFDESFVTSAPLEEYSARERLQEDAVPVRQRDADADSPRAARRGGVALAALLLTAALAALYLSTGRQQGGGTPVETPPPASTVLPLQPDGPVPGGVPAELYEAADVADFGAGSAAVRLPEARRTERYSRDQVAEALVLVRSYVVASSLLPEVIDGSTTLPVRELLRPEQQRQLDTSLSGRSQTLPVSTWLIRLDPAAAQLADEQVRTETEFHVDESGQRLEITVRQFAAYAVRPADQPRAAASLLVVRRDLAFGFDDADLRAERVALVSAEVAVGPLDCAEGHPGHLRPLLAEEAPRTEVSAVDPFGAEDEPVRPCALLATD